jgi:hypothetical protein
MRKLRVYVMYLVYMSVITLTVDKVDPLLQIYIYVMSIYKNTRH